MSDSIYRPSGRRKGTHLRGSEITERLERDARAYAKHLSHIHSHFHCSTRTCAARLKSIVYDKRRTETADMIFQKDIAVLACEYGHETVIEL